MSHTPRSLISLLILSSPAASLSASHSAPSLYRRRVPRRERYKHLPIVSASPMHHRTLSHAPSASLVPPHAPFPHAIHTHISIHCVLIIHFPPPYNISRAQRAGYVEATACPRFTPLASSHYTSHLSGSITSPSPCLQHPLCTVIKRTVPASPMHTLLHSHTCHLSYYTPSYMQQPPPPIHTASLSPAASVGRICPDRRSWLGAGGPVLQSYIKE